MYLLRSSLMVSINEVISKSGCRDGGVWDGEWSEAELEFLFVECGGVGGVLVG